MSSSAAAIVARLVTAGASLVSISLAARSLTTSELGVVAVLTTLAVFLGFGDFGLGSMLMTRLPAADARSNVAEARQLVSSVTSALLIISTATLALGTASIFVLPWREILGAGTLSTQDLRLSLAAFVISGALGIVATTGTRILLALQRGALVRTLNAVAALVSVASVLACSALDAAPWAFVLALCAPTTVMGLVALQWSTRVLYPQLRLDRAVFDVAAGLRCLGSGLGYAVLSLGWIVAYTLDSVVVSAKLGATAAALFSVAARLFNLVGGTLQLAGQQMWPAISEALERGDVAWVRARFRHSLIVAAVVSTAGCAVLVLAGPFFARVWVGSDLVPPVSLFLAFAGWTIYLTVMTQYSYLLLARDRFRALAVLGLLVAAVNLAASMLLTDAVGISGPVLGNLAAAALVQLVPTIVMSRRLRRELGLAGGTRPAATIDPRPVAADDRVAQM